MGTVTLDSIRSVLIRMEESIIFSMIERAQFKLNSVIYSDSLRSEDTVSHITSAVSTDVTIPDITLKSYMLFLLNQTERVHSLAGRYTAPDEHPFTGNLPPPAIKRKDYNAQIIKNSINLNNTILKMYIDIFLPLICETGDDGNYGSSSVNDISILQNLSRRIHYGKFVAEIKFNENPDFYKKLSESNDKNAIIKSISNPHVEAKIIERVKIKAENYGKDPSDNKSQLKLKPEVIQDIYFKYIIPLTKEIEYLYIIERSKN